MYTLKLETSKNGEILIPQPIIKLFKLESCSLLPSFDLLDEEYHLLIRRLDYQTDIVFLQRNGRIDRIQLNNNMTAKNPIFIYDIESGCRITGIVKKEDE